ncbi:hypothetical protein TSUD_420510, partial [Trifolium subterraneum]
MASLNMQRASELLLGVSIFGEPIKSKIIDRANSAMEELCKLGTAAGKPMWHQHEDSYEVRSRFFTALSTYIQLSFVVLGVVPKAQEPRLPSSEFR